MWGGIKYTLNEEVLTGDTWIDGKPIYQKTIERISRVEATTLTFDTGLEQAYVVDYKCRMTLYSGTVVINASGNYDIGSWVTSDNSLTVFSKQTSVTNTVATFYYTKQED